MLQRVEEAKNGAVKVMNLQSDHVETKNKVVQIGTQVLSMGEKMTGLEQQLEKIVQEIEKHKEKLGSLPDDPISKETFKQNLDEITQCFEQYVLNTTPRGGSDDTIKDLEARLCDIENKIVELEKPKGPILRQVFDTEDPVPKLMLPTKQIFRKPELKPKK